MWKILRILWIYFVSKTKFSLIANCFFILRVLSATQNYLTPAKPLANDDFNNRTDQSDNQTKNIPHHHHRSTNNKIIDNHRVIGQSYRHDEIDGQTTASSGGDNHKEATMPLFDENNNNNTGKYIPPRYVPPVSKPISYKRPILKNTGYSKQLQPTGGPTMTQKLCSNDSSLSDWMPECFESVKNMNSVKMMKTYFILKPFEIALIINNSWPHVWVGLNFQHIFMKKHHSCTDNQLF